ncbi:phage tail sheath family protein [Streptacidiphilus anmyonensis]|uniref:phage tail sheath family protein n=1 Tax=Streptacidiphilus anmyonensis TaxID=405782 RepID=UPI0005AB19B7|nr:phage tail sheath subtilisin-like domain-containing protein [Streptacidiphilus anmyonensis]
MSTYLSPGVYVEEVSSGSKPIEGVGTATVAFVGLTEKGPLHEPTLVTNWTEYARTFGDFIADAYLPHALYGYFLNGGGNAYVVRIGGSGAPDGSDGRATAVPPAGPAEARPLPSPPRLQLAAGEGTDKPALTVSARPDAARSGPITVRVERPGNESEGGFRLVVRQDGGREETFDNLSLKGPGNVVQAVRQRSKLIVVEEVKGVTALAPAVGTELVLEQATAAEPAAPPASAPPASLPEETGVAALDADDYVGDAADRTGFAGLEAVEDVTMLAVPDLMLAHQRGVLDEDGVKAVQLAMIAHCELMADRVAILDAPPGMRAQQLRDWRMDTAGYDSAYATLYWPWVKVMDPLSGKPITLPPSGHMAGVWARSDATRGVHKAPANEVLRGVLAPEIGVTRGEQSILNPVGVNCIRSFPGQGIRVWGARTLSSDPEWRYLNVRRLFNFVEKSILQGTNWVVFEPNDEVLWTSVRRTIRMFLRQVWRSGALFGGQPDDSFFIKCDQENNPEESRDQGILNVEIGIAPVKPAEFVVFRISQYSQGAALEE